VRLVFLRLATECGGDGEEESASGRSETERRPKPGRDSWRATSGREWREQGERAATMRTIWQCGRSGGFYLMIV
jgi:hypothetical protein